MKVRRSKSNSSGSNNSNKDMKTSVPNKEKESSSGASKGKSSSQQSSSGNSSSTTMSPTGGATSVGGSKDVSARTLLEKELEEINKKLSNVSLAKGRKSGGGGGDAAQPENEIKLLEKKVLVLLKMKNWKDVRDEGYKILGKKGPNVIIYKCILVSLCRLGKVGSEFEDDVIELLDHWKKSTPKCSQMQDTKRKMEGFLTAIRSGVDPSSLLHNLQDVLGLNSLSMIEVSASEPSWRFRAPPQRHNTFSLCPRTSVGSSSTCIYGEDCVLAHSKEELKEWQIRAQWNKMKTTGCSDNMSPVLNALNNGQSHLLPLPAQTPISKDKIPQSYRSLPNACMYYLLGLNRKVFDTDDISTIFVDSLPDVKFKSTTPLEVKKVFGNTLPFVHKWTFMVASKHPLATVTLYNDIYRDFFAVTSASFINTKRERIDLIEMHPNNQNQKGIQVLNTFIRPDLFLPFNSGWPEWCCYQIEVTFQTMLYVSKVYDQVIIFDFKSDPKISKKLSITVEEPPKISQPSSTSSIQRQPFSYAQASNKTFSHSKSLSASDSDDENNSDGELSANIEVSNINSYPKVPSASKVNNNNLFLPTTTQKPVPLMELNTSGPVIKPPIIKPSLAPKQIDYSLRYSPSPPIHQDLELDTVEQVSRSNYKTWMSLFLRAELRLRQDSLSNLSGIVSVKLSKPGFMSSESNDTCLVGELRLSRDVNKDSKLGRLLLSSCHGLSIRKLSEDVNSKPRFCRIIEKSKHPMKISIDKNTTNEFRLLEGTEERFEVCLFLEQSYLPFINSIFLSHSFRDRHLDLLFPDFNESDEWDINLIVQSRIECSLEDKCTLNTKQREAYQTIVSQSSPQSSHIPVIITGPSGSGKSYLIAHCVVKLSRQQPSIGRSNRIAICTYSDFSANQYITQFLPALIGNSNLKDDLVPLRIYSVGQDVHNVSSDVKKYCVFEETVDGTMFRIPSCQEIYSKRIVVFTIRSCVELLKLGLLNETFSYIFVDETECMLEAEAVCPIVLAGDSTQLVLSGDLMKLQPETFLSDYTEYFRHPTLLQRLEKLYPARHPLKCKLEELYCNHTDIAQLISDEFYYSSLKCAQTQPSSAQNFPLSFCVVHGGDDSQPEYGEGYYNMPEVYEIRDRILSLVKAWPSSWGSPKDHSIVVITPYADQAYALRVRLELNGLSFVDVETLPNVTSKRYKVVILSPVRVFKNEKVEQKERYTDCGFLTNRRAIYTAFSRAQSIIMVVGDLSSLCKFCPEKELWRQYVSLCQRNGSLIGIQNLGYAPVLQSDNGFSFVDKHPHLQYNIPTNATSVSSTPPYYSQPHPQVHDMTPTLTNQTDPFLKRTEPVQQSKANSNLDRLSSIWDTIPSVNQSNSILNYRVPEPFDQNKTWEYSSQSNNSDVRGSESVSSVWNSPVVSNTGSQSPVLPPEQSNVRLMNDATEFRNPFDLPDVKLLAEAALSGHHSQARYPPQIQTSFGFTSKSTNQVYPTRPFTLTPEPLGHSLAAYNFPGLPDIQNSYSLFNSPVNSLPTAPIAPPPPVTQYQGSNSSNIMNLASLNQLPRRQGFAPPPRMLNKARQLSTLSSSEHPKEFDFFKEMGLLNDRNDKVNLTAGKNQKTLRASNNHHDEHKISRCNNEGFALDNTEFPSLDTSGNDEWIEVRSSKKARSPTAKSKTDEQKNKKSKRRSKGELSFTEVFSGESTTEGKEVSVDQKIESLKEMGFEKRHAIKALQMCDKDLARAVDWLILNAPYKKE